MWNTWHLCQSYFTLLPLSWMSCIKFIYRMPSSLSSCLDAIFSISFSLSFFLHWFALHCHLFMTNIPAMLLTPPLCISYKYFPFSFQWKLMIIKWSTKCPAIWPWRKPSRLSSEAFAVVKAMSKTSSLSGTSLLSSITNSSEKNTSLHFCLQSSKYR